MDGRLHLHPSVMRILEQCLPFKRHVRELGLAVHEDSHVYVDQLFKDLEGMRRKKKK